MVGFSRMHDNAAESLGKPLIKLDARVIALGRGRNGDQG